MELQAAMTALWSTCCADAGLAEAKSSHRAEDLCQGVMWRGGGAAAGLLLLMLLLQLQLSMLLVLVLQVVVVGGVVSVVASAVAAVT